MSILCDGDAWVLNEAINMVANSEIGKSNQEKDRFLFSKKQIFL